MPRASSASATGSVSSSSASRTVAPTSGQSRSSADRFELTRLRREAHTSGVARARRHQTFLARLALGLLALVAELVGRSLTHRFNIGRHVAAPSYAGADYYPILLAAVKVGVALMLARLAWRIVRARAVAVAAGRLLAAQGHQRTRGRVRVRLTLSPRLWLASFLATSLIFLVQTDAEQISAGRWPLLAPWLHTSALPVFAVLAVLVALLYTVLVRWLHEVERTGAAVGPRAERFGAQARPAPRRTPDAAAAPRSLFGLAFESRPPPAPA